MSVAASLDRLQVQCCHSAESGLGVPDRDLAQGQRPDVVITDLQLPGMDGFKFRAALAARPALASLPAILITADAKRDIKMLQADHNFFGCLTKPFVLTRLLTMLADSAQSGATCRSSA